MENILQTNSDNCTTEPWGRYSASGGLYTVNGTDYIYSFGGDTSSDADGRGGVVLTNFRFNLDTRCWERLNNSPTEIGYRATATQMEEDPDHVYLLFGADRTRVGTNDFYQYSLSEDTWTQLNTTTTPTNITIPPPRWKHAAVAIDEARILVTGGRYGSTVHADAWILNTTDLSWTLLNTTNLPPMYRHGLAFDESRNVVWIYGGLDDTLARYQSQLWQLDITPNVVTEVQVDSNSNNNPLPPRLASHATEYIAEADVLLMWGGTCSDDSELHIYDPQQQTWCRIFSQNRPDRRDAMLWGLQYPYFYVAQGDAICYSRQVLTLADVHVLDLQQQSSSWAMLYEPTNVPRGTGLEPYCNGTNAGNCQPQSLLPLLEEQDAIISSTCPPDLLARFFNASADVVGDDERTMDPTSTTMVGSSTMNPTELNTITMETTSSPTTIVEAEVTRTGNCYEKQLPPSMSPIASSSRTCANSSGLFLAWMLLWAVKQMA